MSEAHLGTDLRIRHQAAARSAVTLAALGDLGAVEGRENLAQAIWLRLATPMGELAHLGHGTYGSRLYLLIGRLVTPETLALAKAYVREALRREPRIKAVESLTVLPDPTRPGTILVEITVRPEGPPLGLKFEVALAPRVEA